MIPFKLSPDYSIIGPAFSFWSLCMLLPIGQFSPTSAMIYLFTCRLASPPPCLRPQAGVLENSRSDPRRLCHRFGPELCRHQCSCAAIHAIRGASGSRVGPFRKVEQRETNVPWTSFRRCCSLDHFGHRI